MLDLVDRVKSSGQELKGVLKFLNDWEPITTCTSLEYAL